MFYRTIFARMSLKCSFIAASLFFPKITFTYYSSVPKKMEEIFAAFDYSIKRRKRINSGFLLSTWESFSNTRTEAKEKTYLSRQMSERKTKKKKMSKWDYLPTNFHNFANLIFCTNRWHVHEQTQFLFYYFTKN